MASLFQRFFSKLLSSEGSIPPEIADTYSAIISRVLPYFKQLNESNRQKFLRRVYNFRKSKSFHFHGLDPQEEIKILVSAASIVSRSIDKTSSGGKLCAFSVPSSAQ